MSLRHAKQGSSSNIASEFYTEKGADSILSCITNLHKVFFKIIFLSPSKNIAGYYPKLGHDHFISHSFQLIIIHSFHAHTHTVQENDINALTHT